MLKQIRFQGVLFCFVVLYFHTSFGQLNTNSPLDSLLSKDFKYLEDKIFESPNDTIAANYYAQLYLKKAKISNDLHKEIDGFYLLSIINDRKQSLAYSDSALFYSKKYKIKDWEASIFLNKGNLYYSNDEYEDAIENYILASNAIDIEVQTDLYQMVTANIAHTKSIIGRDKEALALYKEVISMEYLSPNPDVYDIDNHLDLLFGLADSYKKNDKLDSASVYNRIGILKSKKYKRQSHYSKFVLNEATNQYEKKNFDAVLDSVNIAIPILVNSTDTVNLAIAYLYKGKALGEKQKIQEALFFYKKTDSIIAIKNTALPYFIEAYDWLYKYYKNNKDLENQLFYLEKLIAYDAKIKTSYNYVDNKIRNDFDIPKLLREKEILITKLRNRNKSSSLRIILLSIAIGMFLILSVYYYKNHITYKKRYKKLLSKKTFLEEEVILKSEFENASLKIPDSVIAAILANLVSFEEQHTYLDSSITLNNLAKTFETNSNYLSKVINLYKNKNFSTYLSDLRINYSITEIRTKPKLLNYKVKALANEFGFRNSESFANAFYKKSGIYPSFYIKQLKKEDN